MNNVAYTVVLLGLMLSSCMQESNDTYRTIVERSITPELTKHMPSSINAKKFDLYFNISPYSNKSTGEQVVVYLEYESSNIDSIISKFELRNPIKYSDSCNVIIYKYQSNTTKSSMIGKEWLYKKWVNKLETCSSKSEPIPNFIEVGEGEFQHTNGISDEFDIYIIEANSGKHFEEKYYGPALIMPEKWKRGYSRGYAINKKSNKVIYWLTIW